jgi:hypothetical protein
VKTNGFFEYAYKYLQFLYLGLDDNNVLIWGYLKKIDMKDGRNVYVVECIIIKVEIKKEAECNCTRTFLKGTRHSVVKTTDFTEYYFRSKPRRIKRFFFFLGRRYDIFQTDRVKRLLESLDYPWEYNLKILMGFYSSIRTT